MMIDDGYLARRKLRVFEGGKVEDDLLLLLLRMLFPTKGNDA